MNEPSEPAAGGDTSWVDAFEKRKHIGNERTGLYALARRLEWLCRQQHEALQHYGAEICRCEDYPATSSIICGMKHACRALAAYAALEKEIERG